MRSTGSWGPAGRRLTLGGLRLIFGFYAGTLVVFATVVRLFADKQDDRSPTLFVVLVCATGLYGMAVARWSLSRPLSTSSPESLASSYRANFFIGLGAGLVPATMGFVGCSITGLPAVYVLGAAFSVVALAMVAPTAGAIRRWDGRLSAEGSRFLLSEALRAPSTTQPARPD